MKNKIAFAFIALFLLGALRPLHGLENITVKEDVFVAKDEVQDNVISFGGNVTVEGRVKENIVAFGGTITLSGEVRDSVVGIGSAITLRSSAVVKGDVISLGGVLNKEPGCVIQGDTVYFKSTELASKIFKGGFFFFPPLIPFILILKLITTFIWLLLAIVIAAIFPRQLSLASSQIRAAFWPVVGAGIAALVLFTGLVIISALLSFVLIGIPFLLFLVGVGVVIKIFGTVVLFYFFGESIGKAFGNKSVAPLAAVILGLILISLIKFIPILGFLFSFCLSIIAWGVVIRTKFGTTESWLRRRA
jgi:cytoskeletal protein CcmA (bactofilin family)